MFKIACLCVAILWVVPSRAQVEPSAVGGPPTLDDTQMMTPPPISGETYPSGVSSESQSNYLSGGVIFTTAYDDNLMITGRTSSSGDETYSILPTLKIERKTARQLESLIYSSGFTFYQHTNAFNAVSQNGTANYQFHLSPYAVINIQDSFRQNSNLFNQTNPFAAGVVSGGAPALTNALISPFANQLENSTSGGIAYQFGRNAMIGADGSYELLHYSSASEFTGLYNSDLTVGSTFYSRRLSRSQYAGAVYRFSRIATHPVNTDTTTHAILGFYTVYLNRTFSVSVLAGPQHYDATQPPAPSSSSWTPTVEGSAGWQTKRTNLAISYSRIVTGGGGLLGAYHSNSVDGSARWQIGRTWSTAVESGYSIYKSAIPIYTSGNIGGHTVIGTASLRHMLSESLNAEVGYSHFHQSYSGIQAASLFPDSNRTYVSISYQFSKPLGR